MVPWYHTPTSYFTPFYARKISDIQISILGRSYDVSCPHYLYKLIDLHTNHHMSYLADLEWYDVAVLLLHAKLVPISTIDKLNAMILPLYVTASNILPQLQRNDVQTSFLCSC